LAVTSVWWTASNIRGLEAAVAEMEPAPAGAAHELRVDVLRTTGPSYGVQCELELGGARHVVLSAAQLTHGRAEQGRVPPLPRGLHRILAARVVSTWPFGLLRARRRILAPTEIVVFPKPVQLPEARSRSEILAELGGAALTHTGDHGPSGLRGYRVGDEPRRVDWKATARRGSLVVKEHEAHAAEGIELSLDRRCEPEHLEHSLSIAAALVLLARDNKESFVLYSQGIQATFGPGHRPWHELLAWLAACESLPATAAPPPPAGPAVVRLPRGDAR